MSAFANSPNPNSVVVDSVVAHGSQTTVTVSGTWTWLVPNGAQQNCNGSRIGVGYAVDWGDNAANPLKPQHGGEATIYVGTPTDDWVHSVTQGTQTVSGPFKKAGGPGGGVEETLVQESMLGETPEGVVFGFGPQGISTGATSAVPTNEDAARWVSNCGPTKQSVVDGQTIGNSNPAEPEKGYPNGTWGPISHTYATPGSYKICPVMYDPHGHQVGEGAANAQEIIAGGPNHNGDNSVEGNDNTSECTAATTIVVTPRAEFTIVKEQKLAGEASYTTNKLLAKVGATVDYKITAKNTGETPESFANFSDPNCANILGGPTGPLAPGQSTSWTCEHTLTATGDWVNVATVQGNERPAESNKVVVVAAAQPPPLGVCASSKSLLRGASGSKRKTFTVRINALGIKEITFYLDGHRLKALKAGQAKHGEFALTIDPAALSYGAHTVSIKAILNSPCAAVAGKGVFVHPRPASVTPKFTG